MVVSKPNTPASRPEPDVTVPVQEPEAVSEAMQERQFFVLALLKRIGYDWPQARRWIDDPDLVHAWSETFIQSGLKPEAIWDTYKRLDHIRTSGFEFPPTMRELIGFAIKPFSDEDVWKSLERAVNVAATDRYDRLSSQEWYAFREIGRSELLTGSRDYLMKRWGKLLQSAHRIQDLPPPPPVQPEQHRLARAPRVPSSEDIRQVADYIESHWYDFITFVKNNHRVFCSKLPDDPPDFEALSKRRYLYQIGKEYLALSQKQTVAAS
ncbi:hypothetical protein [Allochromatium tepidum]|uniref:Uncharacterized protein n=1 Tax=Allochromatium tepidum TaxID=553982 RepID=A0ABN6GFJ9_9GAMM|nr:hypothetical protein [Allochromatium tepidum]BCU08419.1 hypothetical protein Atep_30960 [Allochromatium tepidum]